MIVLGYLGGDLTVRWQYWLFAMLPFLHIVYELLIGLAGATERARCRRQGQDRVGLGDDSAVMFDLPSGVRVPMIGFHGSKAVVAIQVGYCASDIISKCGVGLIIDQVTAAKSALENKGHSG